MKNEKKMKESGRVSLLSSSCTVKNTVMNLIMLLKNTLITGSSWIIESGNEIEIASPVHQRL